MSRALVVLAGAALVVSLGRWAGLAPVVDAAPTLRLFRFPVKAFFTVHFAVSLLATLGLAALLAEGSRRDWRRLAAGAGAMGSLLVLAMTLPNLLPGSLASFGSRFFPPGLDDATRAGLMGRVLSDAALGGLGALALGATALLVLRGALRPSRGTALAAAVVGADLLRAGAGLNPMVSPSFFRPSLELQSALPRLREGRVFTCSLDESPAYRAARAARGSDHERWSFAALQETLTPFANLRLGVATALSPDLTMLVSEQRVLSPEDASCRDLDRILPRLREAGVRRVLSVSRLEHPDLVLEGTLRPARTAPLEVGVYATKAPRAWLEIDGGAPSPGAPGGRVIEASRSAGHIEAVVETGGPATLAVGEGWAPGWTATVDARPVDVARTPRGRMSVPVPGGRSRVVLRFRPRGMFPGLLLGALGTLATAALLRRRLPEV